MAAHSTLSAPFLPARCGFGRYRMLCVNVTVSGKLCASVEKKCPSLLEGNSSAPTPGERRYWYTLALHGWCDASTGAPYLRERLPSVICGKREAHLWHVRNLSLLVVSMSLHKGVQNRLNFCSE